LSSAVASGCRARLAISIGARYYRIAVGVLVSALGTISVRVGVVHSIVSVSFSIPRTLLSRSIVVRCSIGVLLVGVRIGTLGSISVCICVVYTVVGIGCGIPLTLLVTVVGSSIDL